MSACCTVTRFVRYLSPLCGLALLAGCSSGGGAGTSGSIVTGVGAVESCMSCHNMAQHNDYSGSGLENPHPFGGAATLRCTTCHGGNAQGGSMAASHVPPPPEIGDETKQLTDARAYFNRLTLAGIDKFADYTVNGVTYTSLEYLQFINPGDIRVAVSGRGCGSCHMAHALCTSRAPLVTEMGIFSSARYTLGVDFGLVPESAGLYEDTASEIGFRAVTDPNYVMDPANSGVVGRLVETPVFSVFGQTGGTNIFNNANYFSANLNASSLNADNSVVPNSPLANLFNETIAFQCGDCHFGSAGANNRYGDFRSSGCTACHMRYSQSGRSTLSDPNIVRNEPLDVDDIDEPERAHVNRHMIKSIARTLPSGEVVGGIDDHTCVGCHQGSNRTVLQYWGIRLDQNADLVRRQQYPTNPVRFTTTARDTRLFDPVIGNRTFNGRNSNQYILSEDYDGDNRDDTPADVHYDAGLGCIDCHGSHDLHGGNVKPEGVEIKSKMELAVAIQCESCHGTVDAYATTAPCVTYDGVAADCAADAEGLPLKHVTRNGNNEYFLVSRLDGRRHYVPQTRDVVVDNGKRNPLDGNVVYNAKASYAMGRVDNDPSNGTGPKQVSGVSAGFSHLDNVSCVACHASWQNNCVGCHLKARYNTGNNFSNVTGERIVFQVTNADFSYITPVPFQLGVKANNKINPIMPNTEAHFQWRDQNNIFSQVYTFTDRNGNGNNPNTGGRNQFPALQHNVMMPHSIRGRVTSTNEGPRYCVACHLTQDGLTTYGAEYNAFRTAMATNNFGALDFNLLKDHFGKNTGNQLDSPLWVHQVAGLGSGMFLFEANGCPVNPLDPRDDRFDCNGVSPQDRFALAAFNNVAHNLDRIVEETGVSNASNAHAMLNPGQAPNLRDGSLDPNMAGPLGATLIRKLADPATGIVLDSWIDANGTTHGATDSYLSTP